jgi:DNA-binding NarL/FixJ family response regulator
MQQVISTSASLEQPEKPLEQSRVILVVEDHDVYRDVVRAAMARHLPDFKMLDADCVSAALAVLASNKIDVMVVDMTLPDGSAVDLVERADAFIKQGLKAIVFSSHSSADMLPVLSRCDVHGYVPKELGLKALADAILRVF